jgi:hypothetical protein
MRPFVENIEDLKANREEIIEAIKLFAETKDMNLVSKIMAQLVNIVTASNYQALDIDIYESIEMAVKDVMSKKIDIIDMCEVNKANMIKNLPSSMR